MNAIASNLWNRFFGSNLDFRVWQFNLLSLAVILVCLVNLFIMLLSGRLCSCAVHTSLIMAFQAGLLWYSLARGRYMFCYMATIIGTFCVGFSYMFLVSGGYRGYTPSFFIFAVVITAFLLDGKKRIVMIAVELALYVSLCAYAYIYPDRITHYASERHNFFGIMDAFLTVSIALGVTMTLQINLYRQRMRELDAARRQAEDYATMKSELFAKMSHEMRTPLTVMSAYAQYAVKQIRKNGANEETLAGLSTVSDEAKRLAEMANGALRVLTASGGADEPESALVNAGDLSARLADMFKPIALQKGRTLTAAVSENIPPIRGDAAALTQLIWNILQNAVMFSSSKVTLTAEAHTRTQGVKIKVVNDGDGIAPDILPRVFERGVSGSGGGSGMGLAICRDIAARHNGDIAIQSEPGVDTCVTVILNGMGIFERGGGGYEENNKIDFGRGKE